jgi:hypothetical protein
MRNLLIAIGTIPLLGAVALAQPMMCGNGIIDPGDSEARVLALCGPPDASRQWTEFIPAGDDYQGYVQATQIPMAEWVYQNNPDQFVSKVVFENGVVRDIGN